MPPTSPIEKYEQTIETTVVTYEDTTYTDGSFTGSVDSGQVTITVANIDGTTTIRVPTAHLARVRAMLDHIAEDLPPMPEPEPEADPA
ncbi:MAG: hypothetical protein RJQ01_08155 [Microcella sp.]|uniref:hypothetical protein n=1 Tax=Microcella sp. TaxID=1913979 RepID=UPI003315A07F